MPFCMQGQDNSADTIGRCYLQLIYCAITLALLALMKLAVCSSLNDVLDIKDNSLDQILWNQCANEWAVLCATRLPNYICIFVFLIGTMINVSLLSLFP